MAGSGIHIIRSETHLQELAADLCEKEPRFLPALARVGHVPLRTLPRGFTGLVRIIIGQQVSTLAAQSIFNRLEAGLPGFTPGMIHLMPQEELRAFGLSTPKVRAIKALADALVAGDLEPERLHSLPDAAVSRALASIKGIGPWTAEIYLLFALGRADVWPARDLALQKALHELAALRKHPTAEHTERLARRWRPMRGVAAHLLWAYYNHGRSAPVTRVNDS